MAPVILAPNEIILHSVAIDGDFAICAPREQYLGYLYGTAFREKFQIVYFFFEHILGPFRICLPPVVGLVPVEYRRKCIVHNYVVHIYIVSQLELYRRKLRGRRVIAIGDSFGANFMLSACLKLREENLPLPNALISISCFIDLAATGDSYKKTCYRDPLYALPKNQRFEDNERFVRRKSPYCGTTPPHDPFLSPAYAEYNGFPQTLIQCGDCETSASDSQTLYARLKTAGVKATFTEYRGMWHDFQYFTPFLKESKAAWKEIERFVQSYG